MRNPGTTKVSAQNPTDCIVARTSRVLHHLSFPWRNRARSVLAGIAEATQQVLVLSYEGRKAWSGEQSRNHTGGVWGLGCYLSNAVFLRFHPSLPHYFSQSDFQGSPTSSLSYEKCDDGEKKNCMWSRKVSRRKKIHFSLLWVYFNGNLHGLLYTVRHVGMPVCSRWLGLFVLTTITAEQKNNVEIPYQRLFKNRTACW